MRVVVVGGGWSGCAAAIAARKQGADTVLIERMDMLLGTGLVGGIMRNNGRFTATEEMLAMGGGDLFSLTDKNSLHRHIDFPGHKHASLYNVATMEPIVMNYLLDLGVEIHTTTRITGVTMAGNAIGSVTAKRAGEESEFAADVFVDTTGTAGPPANCSKHGNGCAMCVLRCHAYGGRVSVTAKAGVKEIVGCKGDQIGAMSGSCKLLKESLSADLINALNTEGVVVVPLPKANRKSGKLAIKCCQQYATADFADNVILLNTGHAKLMTPFFPLDELRQISGFEYARFEDPYAGGLGNSIRYVGMAPRDNALKVEGVENLFCGGEKAGLLVGHTEAICTGTLAGYNAVRHIGRNPLLELPDTLAVGDSISHVGAMMQTRDGLGYKFTFSGSIYFERMMERGLYSTDARSIEKRVEAAGLTGVFAGS